MAQPTKTYQNVLDEAAVLLQDTGFDRYTETVLIAKLNRGLQELGRLRPDAFWDFFDEETGEIVVPIVAATDPDPDSDTAVFDAYEDADAALTDAINWPLQFYPAIVYFVAASAELVEDEFTNDGRAITLMQEFKRMVMGL